MKGFVEGAVTTNGVTLHYWRCTSQSQVKTTFFWQKSTRHTLVLLHGTTENGRCWSRVAYNLCQYYHLVIPDSRGHGLSESPETGYGIDDRTGDVAGIIKSLELDRPILVGYSLGAETAVGVASAYPDLVRAIILEEPPWPGRFYGSTQEERAERAKTWRDELVEQKKKTKRELINIAHEQHPNWVEEELEPWAEAKKQVSPDISNIVFAPRRRWSDYLREVDCPILLVTANPSFGAVVSEQTVREASVYWKNGRSIPIQNAGHSIHREQPDQYIKAVRNFIDKSVR